MKITKLLLAGAVLITVFSSCQSNGKKYDYNGKQNIYYKGDGLDEAAAKKLANYLNEIKYFGGDKELSVQMTKDKATGDTTNINFVVDPTKITPEIESAFMQIGGMISTKVYNGGPVNMCFIDDHFKLIKKLGYAQPVVEEATPPVEEDQTKRPPPPPPTQE